MLHVERQAFEGDGMGRERHDPGVRSRDGSRGQGVHAYICTDIKEYRVFTIDLTRNHPTLFRIEPARFLKSLPFAKIVTQIATDRVSKNDMIDGPVGAPRDDTAQNGFILWYFNARTDRTAVFPVTCVVKPWRVYLNYYQDAECYEACGHGRRA